MEYRQLGNSGLMVSTLTLGTMTFGGKGNFAKVGSLSLKDVSKLIDIVADVGVNLIDTANVYSAGHSEELIGEAMGAKRKPGMLIATKARYPMGPGPTTAACRARTSSANARRASSASGPTLSISIKSISGTG
jgi:aryl-alcohol dehydrogenase-like predicted oxidoreductase